MESSYDLYREAVTLTQNKTIDYNQKELAFLEVFKAMLEEFHNGKQSSLFNQFCAALESAGVIVNWNQYKNFQLSLPEGKEKGFWGNVKEKAKQALSGDKSISKAEMQADAYHFLYLLISYFTWTRMKEEDKMDFGYAFFKDKGWLEVMFLPCPGIKFEQPGYVSKLLEALDADMRIQAGNTLSVKGWYEDMKDKYLLKVKLLAKNIIADAEGKRDKALKDMKDAENNRVKAEQKAKAIIQAAQTQQQQIIDAGRKQVDTYKKGQIQALDSEKKRVEGYISAQTKALSDREARFQKIKRDHYRAMDGEADSEIEKLKAKIREVNGAMVKLQDKMNIDEGNMMFGEMMGLYDLIWNHIQEEGKNLPVNEVTNLKEYLSIIEEILSRYQIEKIPYTAGADFYKHTDKAKNETSDFNPRKSIVIGLAKPGFIRIDKDDNDSTRIMRKQEVFVKNK